MTVFWPGLLSSAVVPRWALLAIGLPLVSWLDPRRLSPLALVLLGATLAYAALSLLWAADPMVGGGHLIKLFIFVAAILLGAELEEIDPLLRVMAWGVAVSIAFALAHTAGWSGIAQAVPPAGLFYNRDFLAEIAAAFFVWAVLSRDIPLTIVLSIPLAICGSRIALLCVAAGLIAVWAATRQWRVVALMGILLAAGLVAVTILYPDKIATAADRVQIWRSALGGVSWWGNGLGSFTAAHPGWEYAHSDLLQSVYEFGVGALPLAGIFVLAFRAPASVAVFGMLACFAVECVTAFPLHLPASTFVVGLLLGHLVRRRVGVRVV